jgi:hypothetical protein
MREGTALVAPLVEDVLNAAHDVAAAGLEMDSRVDPELNRALRLLVQAVYEHEDALELQRELEAEGVREAHVFDVTADRPPTTSYPAHVERIISAADGVAGSAAAPTSAALPTQALAPVCTLMEAITAYHAHASVAQQWQSAGNRFALLRGEGPDDMLPPPPSTSPRPANQLDTAADVGARVDPSAGGTVASACAGAAASTRATPPTADDRRLRLRARAGRARLR